MSAHKDGKAACWCPECMKAEWFNKKARRVRVGQHFSTGPSSWWTTASVTLDGGRRKRVRDRRGSLVAA